MNIIWWKPFIINNFFILNFFEVKESILRCFSKLPWSHDLEKSRSTSGFGGILGYCRLGLMDFSNLFIPYDFDVRESVYRSFTLPLYSDDFEIPGQLPVLQELEGTDGWVLWIFVISSLSMFSRSRNLFLVVSQSNHVQVTARIQVNFRFRRYSRVLSTGSYGFQ